MPSASSHAWGNPDWDRIALTRSLGIWFADGTGVAFGSVQPAGARAHATEAACAALMGPRGAVTIREPRLSPRATATAGSVAPAWGCGPTMATRRGVPRAKSSAARRSTSGRCDSIAPSCWHMEGREGIGRYDVLRRA
jgi:hypothetical protein